MAFYRPKHSSPMASSTTSRDVSVAGDKMVPPDATDTISALRWSPASNHLAASSWDSKVRIYDVGNDLSATGVAVITTLAPVFSCDWSLVSSGYL
jgi:mRNA export factor